MKMDFHPQKISTAALLGLCIVLSSATVLAGERYEFFNGVRSMGMGGTQVAVVNDETALLANPAALGRLRDYFLTVADPELELGAETQNIIGADVMAFLDPQKTHDMVVDKPGQRFHQRAQLFPSFVVTNFGFGVYGRYSMDAWTDSPATVVNLNYRSDLAFVFGFNFRMFDGRVKLGINARGVNRTEIMRDDLAVNATGLSIGSMASEGFGVASDVGLMLTAPWQWLPTLAVVYRDVGTTSYDLNSGLFMNTSERPDRTPATLDAGFSVQPILGKGNRMSFSAELVDTLAKVEPEEEDDIKRRLHYGVEFNFGDMFFLRGGMNQGYWTAGVELAMFNYQLQAATYGEEVGTKADPEEERRYVGKFSWRF